LQGQPLVNFINLLTLSIETKNLPLFEHVVEQYKIALLSRDATLQRYIESVPEVHFGIKKQVGGLAGMLGGLMQNLFK